MQDLQRSFFEHSLMEPNSAQLSPGPEGNKIIQYIPGQRSPRFFSRDGKGQLGFFDMRTVPSPMLTCTCSLKHSHEAGPPPGLQPEILNKVMKKFSKQTIPP